MSLISRLSGLLHGVLDPITDAPDREGQIAVAALLALVARADGRLLKVEEENLERLLRARFGLSPEAAARLLARGEEINREMDPASTVAERILHDIQAAERPDLLAMAYRIAAVDGQVHDFEEDLLWRVGRLLGLTDEDVARVRERALGPPAVREA
jgi:uncharacterized tellurite resistance protein B-like protein